MKTRLGDDLDPTCGVVERKRYIEGFGIRQ